MVKNLGLQNAQKDLMVKMIMFRPNITFNGCISHDDEEDNIK